MCRWFVVNTRNWRRLKKKLRVYKILKIWFGKILLKVLNKILEVKKIVENPKNYLRSLKLFKLLQNWTQSLQVPPKKITKLTKKSLEFQKIFQKNIKLFSTKNTLGAWKISRATKENYWLCFRCKIPSFITLNFFYAAFETITSLS